jgi:endonuclease-8
MPEGDSLHRAARRLQVLVGDRVGVETPNPRARGKRLAERLDGLVLESVEAIGKNLLLRFEGGVVLRSHLRMTGRWRVYRRGTLRPSAGPWLVLRGREWEAAQWNGPVLTIAGADRVRRLGPDVLASSFDVGEAAGRLRADARRSAGGWLGEALQDQRLVAGIGNMWMAEAAWEARVSPWLPVAEATDEELRAVLAAARRLMRASVDGSRGGAAGRGRHVYRRAGRPCRRCGAVVQSRGQGDANRTAYWCPGCQRGPDPPAPPAPRSRGA